MKHYPDSEIRKMILEDNERVRSLLISESAIELYRYIASGKGCMTYQIAEAFDLSVQSASTRLRNLCRLGYLSRNQLIAESGGIEYMYYAEDQ